MPEFRARSALWGDQLPRNMDGTLRPQLINERWITVHYTGVWVNYADFDDSPIEIQRIQAYAVSARKPWEYNYVIDTQGVIWEYAGTYQAAHSSGENDSAFGVLLLLGTGDRPTSAMINAFRYLRWVLVAFGNVAAVHEVLPHKQMPGAATPCPGDHVLGVWNALMTPWTLDPPPPLPAPVDYKWIEPNCKFTLQPGDAPYTVARIAYDNGNHYPELITANPGSWSVGRQVTVPGEGGAGFRVRSGDSPWSILRDIWPTDNPAKRLATFLRWNGGPDRVLRPDEIVYAPVDPMS